MTEPTRNALSSPFESADWLDPLEERVRQSIRGFIEHLVESELEAFLGRPRYGRGGPVAGRRSSPRTSGAAAAGHLRADHGVAAAGAGPGQRGPDARMAPPSAAGL